MGGNVAVALVLSTLAGMSSTIGTFLGGSAGESDVSIAVDASGASHVTGGTTSSDLPTTPGVLDSSYHVDTCGVPPFYTWPVTDAFVFEVSADGTGLDYGTYLAGASDDAATGIAVDALGRIYLTGGTMSSDFPITADAYQAALAGGRDGSVTKLMPLNERTYVSLVLKNYP